MASLSKAELQRRVVILGFARGYVWRRLFEWLRVTGRLR